MHSFNTACSQEAITTLYLALANLEIMDGKLKERLQIKSRLILWLHLSDVASCYTQDYFTSDSIEIRAPQPYHHLCVGYEGMRLWGHV